jgi:hypothetical protein
VISFTQRLSTETAVEVIGGSDKYIAVCRHCYLTNAAATMAKDDAMLSTSSSSQSSSKKDSSSSQQSGPSTPSRKRFAKRKSLNSPKKIASPAKRIAKRRRSQGNHA